MQKDDLELRVYTSNLLGKDDTLVLHGGGNTSVKIDDILYVKGSGWDLVSIKKEGFAPVKLNSLIQMAKMDKLSDSDMVSMQKEAMIDKSAPNPSVEAILHAIIPFKYVDHTHSDAIVTISNSINGGKYIKELYPNFLIVPYVMPGFILAKTIYDMTQNINWEELEGIILHNHGIFTFDDNGMNSYHKMLDSVKIAQDFLNKNTQLNIPKITPKKDFDIDLLKQIISEKKGYEVVMKTDQSPLAVYYASLNNLTSKVTRGVLTPEHIIRTKRIPVVIGNNNIKESIDEYIKSYEAYFKQFTTNQIMLNPAPNYAVIKNFGIIFFGKNEKEVNILNDIIEHTMLAVLKADQLGGYKSISLKDSFDMEYWELEQAKLKK